MAPALFGRRGSRDLLSRVRVPASHRRAPVSGLVKGHMGDVLMAEAGREGVVGSGPGDRSRRVGKRVTWMPAARKTKAT